MFNSLLFGNNCVGSFFILLTLKKNQEVKGNSTFLRNQEEQQQYDFRGIEAAMPA